MYSVRVGRFIRRHKNWLTSYLLWVLVISLFTSVSNFAPLTFKVPAARATDPDLLMFVDSNSPLSAPTGWTCVSCYTTDTFYNRYVYGSNSYGTQAGSATHTHSLTYVSEVPETVALNADNKGTGTATPGNQVHTHGSLASSSITADFNLPAYNSLLVYRYTAGGVPATIPQGGILLFETTSMSTNWEIYTTQNSQFLRGSSTTATGGNSTPTHGVASGLAATNASTTVSASLSTFASPTHSHSASSVAVTDGPSIEPPYREVVFGRATATISAPFPTGMIAGFTSTSVGSAWSVVSDAGGIYKDRFLKGKGSGTLGTGGSSTHSHINVVVTTGQPVGTVVNVDNTPSRVPASTSSHTHSVTIQLGANVDHTPEYATLVLAQYTAPVYKPLTRNWRWYADEEDVTPGTAYAAENTAPPIDEMGKNTRLKLRINISNTGGAAENDSRKKLQFTTDISNWIDVGATGSSSVWRYYNGGGDDNGVLPSVLLTDSSTTSTGIFNESSSNSPSNSDHPADTVVEFEYCVEAYNAAAGQVHIFRLYDQVLAAAISPESGKSNSTLRMGIFALTVGSPSAVFLGTWPLGEGGYHSYTFVGGEEITNRDNRGLDGGGNSSGWTCSVEVTANLTSGGDQITGSDMYWISYTTDITPLYDAPTTGMSGNTGEAMTNPVTVITVSGSGYQGLGGFTMLPTIEIRNAPATGDYTGGVLTLTTI